MRFDVHPGERDMERRRFLLWALGVGAIAMGVPALARLRPLDAVWNRSWDRFVKPDPTVTKILEISRLDRRFNIHDTIESAAKSLR